MSTDLYIETKVYLPRRIHMQNCLVEASLELERIAQGTLAQFQACTATWTHKPQFEVRRRRGRTRAIFRGSPEGYILPWISVTTDDPIFAMVNDGVPAHSVEPDHPRSKINPSRPSALSARPKGSYKAKTAPRSRVSRAGGQTGRIAYKPGVWHPGYKGRDFITSISRWTYGQMEAKLAAAIEKGLYEGVGGGDAVYR